MRHRTLFDDPAPPPPRSGDPPASRAGFVPVSELARDVPERALPPPGIARLAALAAAVDARNQVEYRDLPCRTLVSRCTGERVPFDGSINPYRGCEFGCAYCYARYTHEYMELDSLAFERTIFVKRGAANALREDLRRLDLHGRWIAIGTATDPYQPAERRFGVTRQLLEVLASRRGLRLSLTTKSDAVVRDLELLKRIARANQLRVNVTVTTPHTALARRLEPRAPRPDRRLLAVRTLTDAGLCAGVFAMPLMPGINDAPEDLDLLFRLARDAGARFLVAQPLFLRSSARKRFFPFLEENFPELLPLYRRLYASGNPAPLEAYTRQLMDRVRELRARYALPDGRRSEPLPAVGDQLTLPVL